MTSAAGRRPAVLHAVQRVPLEWTYTSGRHRDDPFNDIELDVVVDERWTVPAFWAGDRRWTVRFAAPEPGSFRYRTVCSDPSDEGLHGIEGAIEVAPYEGSNPLLRRGSLRVAAGGRYLEHEDGTPFFWLAETWTWGLRRSWTFPDDFRVLLQDRAAKGFNSVLIAAGLYPGMKWPDERARNEAGLCWTAGFERIDPAYFDMADLRIDAIVRAGLVPCIQGLWGYYREWMTQAQIRRHWRYLVARWAASPVVWCAAGEALMTFASYDRRRPGEVFHELLPADVEQDLAAQRRQWTELCRYIRSIDPYDRLITIHPRSPGASRDQVDDTSVLDVDMLQTGHLDRDSMKPTVDTIVRSRATDPPIPVINGEVAYEGLMEMNRQEIVRCMFWACMLSGACGHTYGTQGVELANTEDDRWGAAPHGMAWDNTPWDVALRYPGAADVGLGRRILERFEWWRFEPHPEWVEPHWSPENYFHAFAAGIPGQVRVIYFPPGAHWRREGGFRLAELEPGAGYRAYYVDPASGREYDGGHATGDADGHADVGLPPVVQDWVLVLERA